LSRVTSAKIITAKIAGNNREIESGIIENQNMAKKASMMPYFNLR
jgi:hypothetical protein